MVQLSAGQTVIASEPVSVTMPEFLVYNHKLDTIESGLAAGLLLSVDVASGLRLGWYLKGENA